MKLINDDALIALTKLEENSIDLTVTSPPYDNLRKYNGNNDQWGESVWKSIIEELYTVTKEGGVVVWVVGDATIKGSETGTSFKQALWAMECGFRLHDTMIWNKAEFSAVGSLSVRYAPVFEYMFVFSKGAPSSFKPIIDRKNKHARATVNGTIRQSDGGTKPISGSGKKKIRDFGQRHNVWEMTGVKSRKDTRHPAAFPESLAADHIISWSNEGDTVLDCFMGSGTTGVACRNLNRDFIGIEIDETYFNIAKERIKNHLLTEGIITTL